MSDKWGDVSWEKLEHAYGPATDTPNLLEAVRLGTTVDEVARPFVQLEESVLHQGSVYSATAPALDRLLSLLHEPSHPAAPLVVEMLPLLTGAFEFGRDLPEVAAVRQVVVGHWPTMSAWLSQGSDSVRSTLAGFCALLHEVGEEVHHAFADRWTAETSDIVKADMLMSAAKLADNEPGLRWTRDRIHEWWTAETRFRRVASAAALSRVDSDASEAMDFLLGCLPDVVEPVPPEGVRSYWGVGWPALTVELWSSHLQRPLDRDLPSMLEAVLRTSPFIAETMLDHVLERVFPDRDLRLPDYARDLDPTQLLVVRTLAANPKFFENKNIMYGTKSPMHHRHLPSSAPDLRRWLRGATRFDCVAPGIQQLIRDGRGYRPDSVPPPSRRWRFRA